MERPFEIVHVITSTQLIDAESYQRTLGTNHVNRVQPGFYVVLWPSGDGVLRYDESAEFVGPFESRAGAEVAYGTLARGDNVHLSSISDGATLVA